VREVISGHFVITTCQELGVRTGFSSILASGCVSGASCAGHDIALTLGSGVLAAAGPKRDEGKDLLILPDPILKIGCIQISFCLAWFPSHIPPWGSPCIARILVECPVVTQ